MPDNRTPPNAEFNSACTSLGRFLISGDFAALDRIELRALVEECATLARTQEMPPETMLRILKEQLPHVDRDPAIGVRDQVIAWAITAYFA